MSHRESLRDFVFREAGTDEASRLDLLRHLAPSVFVSGGYDFNELMKPITEGPGWIDSGGSEYVSPDWPEVPVERPLPCITIRPFKRDGYDTIPYEFLAAFALHMREILVRAESSPDFEVLTRFAYIEPENLDRWKAAAKVWREETQSTQPQPAPAPERAGDEPTTAQTAPTWSLTKPKRFQGYTEPLYLLLESAHISGKPKPTARDVLLIFGRDKPQHIAKVIAGDSFDYYLANGKTKSANLKAIAAAIAGMTGKGQD